MAKVKTNAAGKVKCPNCGGRGHVREWQLRQNVGCEDCAGTGWVEPAQEAGEEARRAAAAAMWTVPERWDEDVCF